MGMRVIRKTWHDTLPRWTKRVRWYERSGEDIKLVFEDEFGTAEQLYDTVGEADEDYVDFAMGFLTTDILKGNFA